MNYKKISLAMAAIMSVQAIPVVAVNKPKEMIKSYQEVPSTTGDSINVTTNSAIKVTTTGAIKIEQIEHLQILRQSQKQIVSSDEFVEPIKWESSNTDIVTVDEKGMVSTKEKGYGTITATDANGSSQKWRIEVMYMENIPVVEPSEYKAGRQVWLESIIGNGHESQYIDHLVSKVQTEAKEYFETIDTTTGEILWRDDRVKDYKTAPGHIKQMYLRVEAMAKGYAMKGSSEYKNAELLEAIEYALEWLHNNAYGIQRQYGNWWEWEIGVPKHIINIMTMLYEDIDYELFKKVTDVVYYHQPDPFHAAAGEGSRYGYRESTGANRIDAAVVAMGLGILREDYEQLQMAKDATETVIKYEQRSGNANRDGFYEDGSFIQHGHVPYTGTYGGVLYTGTTDIINTLAQTKWAISQDKVEHFTQIVLDSFIPIIYKGAALDMLRGRAIAREWESDRVSGNALVGTTAVFANAIETVQPEASKLLKGYVKTWITAEQFRPSIENMNYISRINQMEDIMNDASVEVLTQTPLHKDFSLMDRVVHRTENALFGLSMHSDRISNYEKGNQTENPFGWHTSDGMTYLYNEDLSHYTDNYWNTVNMKRLPGTTVDTVQLSANQNAAKKMNSSWVGGVAMDEMYGTNGMWFKGQEPYQSLEARKSWFMFDDEIVCVGSGIKSTDNRDIETIIENRKLKTDASNAVTVEGQQSKFILDGKEEAVDAKWIHLEGNVEGADIGYYFPTSSQKLHMKKVARTGKWKDIHYNTAHEDEATRNYLEMWVEHGVNPVGDTYDYVLLPGKSAEEVKTYAESSDIEILAQDEDAHGVREKALGMSAVNFWKDQVHTVAGITVNKKASVMVKETANTIEVAISDPTMRNTGNIEVELDVQAYDVLEKDSRIKDIEFGEKVKFSVDVNRAEGETIKLILKKEQKAITAKNITINGQDLPHFSPHLSHYEMKVPFGTSQNLDVQVDTDHDVKVTCPQSLPGEVKIELTSKENPAIKESYTVDVSIDMEWIFVNGEVIKDLSADRHTYEVELPIHTTKLPEIKLKTAYESEIKMPTSLPGRVEIILTSKENAEYKEVYYIDIKLDKEWIKVSSEQEGNERDHSVDNIAGTRWAAQGRNEWIQYYLGEDKVLSGISILPYYTNNTRKYTFDVQTSMDGENWTTMYKDYVSGGRAVGKEYLAFDSQQEVRFVRIIGRGNTDNDWNNIDQVDFHLANQEFAMNPGFEEHEACGEDTVWSGSQKASQWRGQSYTNYDIAGVSLDTQVKHSGEAAVKFETKTDGRAGIYQVFEAAPETTYEVSFFAKTQNLQPEKFGLQVYEVKTDGKYVTTDAKTTLISDLEGTQDWKQYTYSFTTGKQTQRIKLQFTMGPLWKAPKGTTVWIDDVSWKEESKSVTGVSLSDEKLVGMVEGQYPLTADVQPANASNKNVIWSSKDENIASVDEKGVVTFKKEGKTILTVTTEEGKFTDTCEVEVKKVDSIEKLAMPEHMRLMVDEVSTIKPVAQPNIVGLKLDWTSSNEQVAKVDSKGKVTALSEGETTITAACGEIQVSTTLEVIKKANNKVINGNFEQEEGGLPVGFSVESGLAEVKLDSSEAYLGNQSIKIQAPQETKVVLGTKDWISAKDGIYGLSLNLKTEGAKGKFRIDVKQDKTDNVKLTDSFEYELKETSNGWYSINIPFDGINVLRNVDFDLVFEGSGNLWIDDFKFYDATRIQSIGLEDMTIDLGSVDYNALQKVPYTINPQRPHDTRIVWQSSDSHILEITEEGYLIPKKQGTVEITALTKDHKVKDVARVTLVGEVPDTQRVEVESLALEKGVVIEAGEGAKLNLEVAPANYTHLELDWASSNPEIAVVHKGRVIAKSEGVATITVKDRNGAQTSTLVTVTPRVDDKFDQVRQQWNLKIRKRHDAKEYDEMIDKYWATMNKDEKRLYLWDDLETDYRNGVRLGDVTKRLVLMATATTLPESKYYNHDELQADLAEAIVWINEDYLGKEHESYRKSWHWNIGLPKDMADLYMVLYDYLDADEIKEGMEFVAYEATPEDIADFSAANLVDAGKSRIGAHILFKNEEEVTRYINMALGALSYVNEGSGFYEDGSFVEHENIAYTGSYGTVLLNGLGDLVDIFGGTQFDIGSSQEMLKLYNILEKTYLPLISFGSFMDNTRGRAISRPGDGDHGEAHVVVSAIIKAGYAAPEPYRTTLLSEAKRIIIEDKEHFETMNNLYVKPNVDKLMKDETIVAADAYVYSHEFGAMNRSVHHTEKFGVGISKSSKRIATFEHLNKENKKGWNTGYGMTHIYNADVNQFKDGYWATINPYRLPGTTADTGVRESSHDQYGDGEGTPKNDWAGGVTLNDTLSTSGMDMRTLRKAGSTLTANKSWFMFDDEVIAVGSKINSKDNRNAETIVENRKIDIEGTNKLTLNGEEYTAALGQEQNVANVEWAHLEGRVEGADIGYYFPEATPLLVMKEQRTGNYSAINGTKNEEHTNTFASMVIDHGKAPADEKYAYAILPGATAKEMAEYAKAPNFKVLAHTNTLHAIKHYKHNALAANFYSEEAQQIDYLRADGHAAVMVQESENYLEIAISDPTMRRNQVVVDLIGKTYLDIVEESEGVKVEKTAEGIRITVDTTGSLSGSYEVKLLTKAIVPEVKEYVVTATAGEGGKITPTGQTVLKEGEKLTLTITPNNGYQIQEVWVNDTSIGKVSTYTIEAIDKDTAIKAIFTKVDDGGNDDDNDSSDNDSNVINNQSKENQAHEELKILQKEVKETVITLGCKWGEVQISEGITKHISKRHWAYETFGKMATVGVIEDNKTPIKANHQVSRGDMVTFLGRLLNLKGQETSNKYKDIDANKEYAKYLDTVTALGILEGEGEAQFNPEGTLTREQMTVILVRLIEQITGEKLKVVETPFKDKDTSAWAKESIQKAYGIGLVNGVTEKMFMSQKEVTLAETLVMLERTMINIAK